MYLFILLIILLAGFIYLLFVMPLKVDFLLDSDEMKMMAAISWLQAIRADVQVFDRSPHISFYFHGRRIFSTNLTSKRKTDKNSLGALSFQNTRIRTFYGLKQPHLTGIFYAASAFLASFANSAVFEQYPEYVPQKEYLRIEAQTDINLGKSALNLIKQKFSGIKRRNKTWIRQS